MKHEQTPPRRLVDERGEDEMSRLLGAVAAPAFSDAQLGRVRARLRESLARRRPRAAPWRRWVLAPALLVAGLAAAAALGPLLEGTLGREPRPGPGSEAPLRRGAASEVPLTRGPAAAPQQMEGAAPEAPQTGGLALDPRGAGAPQPGESGAPLPGEPGAPRPAPRPGEAHASPSLPSPLTPGEPGRAAAPGPLGADRPARDRGARERGGPAAASPGRAAALGEAARPQAGAVPLAASCEDAMADFALTLEGVDGDTRGNALYRRGLCHLRRCELQEAAADLRTYLRLFPRGPFAAAVEAELGAGVGACPHNTDLPPSRWP